MEARYTVSAVVGSKTHNFIRKYCWDNQLSVSKGIGKLLDEYAEQAVERQKELELEGQFEEASKEGRVF